MSMSAIAPYRLRQKWWLGTIVLGFVVLALAQVAAMVTWAIVGGASDVSIDAMLADGTGWKALLAMGVQAGVALVLMPLVLRWTEKRRATEYSLRGRHAAQLGWGLLLGLVVMSVSVGIVALTGHYRVTDVGWTPAILTGIGVGLGAGVAEEIFFRATLMRLLEGRMGTIAALVLTSAAFGAVHMNNPGATVWTGIAITIEAGILLGACWILTQNIWFVVGVHAAWNAAQSALYGVTVSGLYDSRGLLESELTGPEWLSGGTAGIEGSVVTVLVCLCAAVPLLVVAGRRGRFVPLPGRGRREPEALRRSTAGDSAH